MSDAVTTPAIAAVAADGDGQFALARNVARRRGWLATSRRKLALALGASIALHLLFGLAADVEPADEKSITLAAKLMPLPPPPVPSAAPPRPAKPKPKPQRPRPVATPAAPVVVAAESPVAVAAEPSGDAAPAAAAQEPASAPASEPIAAASPAETALPAPAPEPPPARMPPKKIDLGYTAFLGEQKFEVGPVTLKFTHDDGRYKLRIVGRGRGLTALLYPGTFTGESEGRITGEGLRPDKFVEERGNPDKRREVVFDYEQRLLRLPDKDPLPFEGQPHDALTWIVQFYFSTPKSDRVTLSVGTTRRMDVYTLERAGEEEIEVPTGETDALSGKPALKKVATQLWKGTRKPADDGQPNGSATFWLAPEFHYIPFRLKVVDGKGRSASFDLTAIATE
ncbi:MAG: DUF3108 domain-containing protein [Burkholderiales bacterium]|nr:DUF3108 domain-containing protein [Burkholderiales bacterium]